MSISSLSISAMSISALKHKWNVLTLVMVALLGLWIPLRLVLLDVPWQLDVLIEALVLIYFVAQFFIVKLHQEQNKSLEPNFELGVEHGHLGLEIFAAMPLFSFAMAFSTNPAWSFLLLSKLVLLRKMFRIREILDGNDGLNPVLARLIPLAMLMPLAIHLFACGWIFLGGCTKPEVVSQGPFTVYLYAVYWVITTFTTVGYGDIVPQGLAQMMYANLAMIIGLGFFGFVLSNVASILARIDASRDDYLASLDRVESYMRSNQIPTGLRLKVREYYRYLWENHWGKDDEEVLKSLPIKLQQSIALHINREMIEKVPFFEKADVDIVTDIVSELKLKTVVPNEEIFRQGDPGGAMYFIHRGTIEILNKNEDAPDESVIQHEVLATLRSGSFFGETALLTDSPRNATAKSQSYADIYVLETEAFERVLARYKGFKKYIAKIAAERQAP